MIGEWTSCHTGSLETQRGRSNHCITWQTAGVETQDTAVLLIGRVITNVEGGVCAVLCSAFFAGLAGFEHPTIVNTSGFESGSQDGIYFQGDWHDLIAVGGVADHAQVSVVDAGS